MTLRLIDTDNVRETFAAAASTTVTLAGAAPYSRAVSGIASIATGDTIYGTARNGSEVSTGLWTYTVSGSVRTLTQTTVFYSSNSNAAVTFSSGTGEFFIDGPSRLFDSLNLLEASLAAAATADLASIHGLTVQLTGTTGITSFGTVKNKQRLVRYTGAGLTITNSATLVCPGAVNLVLATGDIFYAVSDNTATPIWRILWVCRADGHPVTTGQATIASATTTDLGSVLAQSITISGTTTITGFGSTAPTGAVKFCEFSGALTLTHNGTSLIIPGAANITTVAGDCLIARHEGSGNWRVLDFSPADRRAYAADGTVSLPGITFAADPDSGLYRIGANNIGLTLNGAKVVDFATTGVAITGTLSVSGDATLSGDVIIPTSAKGIKFTANSSAIKWGASVIASVAAGATAGVSVTGGLIMWSDITVGNSALVAYDAGTATATIVWQSGAIFVTGADPGAGSSKWWVQYASITNRYAAAHALDYLCLANRAGTLV